jgi:hypothetical protein
LVEFCNHKNTRSWFLHPILIKSVLRHIDKLLLRSDVITELYSSSWCSFHDVKSCSLLSIVEDIKMPTNIEIKSEYIPITQYKYECKCIYDPNDMFNDDHLMLECVKHISHPILLDFLLDDLCKIICSYLR